MGNDKNYVVLYNPKVEEQAKHKCGLPTITGNKGGEFTYRAVIECEQCAKKWYAIVWDKEDRHYHKNEWKPLKWYHVRLHFKVAIRKGK